MSVRSGRIAPPGDSSSCESFVMTIEQVLRQHAARTGENGLVYGLVGPEPDWLPLERLIQSVPAGLMPKLKNFGVYFVPWLVKQKRSVLVAAEPKAEGEKRNELCHHLDFRSQGTLAVISHQYYHDDMYGLAMEFFDKVAYVAALEESENDAAFAVLLEQQAAPGELTPDAWGWRQELEKPGGRNEENLINYRRTAFTDALGLYMAAMFMDVYYEDLFDTRDEFPALAPEPLQQRLRWMEKQYPPNRGFPFQVYRQRERRRARS